MESAVTNPRQLAPTVWPAIDAIYFTKSPEPGTGVILSRQATPSRGDIVTSTYFEQGGVGYVADPHPWGLPNYGNITHSMVIPFGTAVTAYVGFYGVEGGFPIDNKDSALSPIDTTD